MINISYYGGIGDSLMTTCVARELKKRDPEVEIGIVSFHLEVFFRNRDVDILAFPGTRMNQYLNRIRKPIHPIYLMNHNWRTDTRDPLREHVLVHMCKRLGVRGRVLLKPYLYLSEEEEGLGFLKKVNMGILKHKYIVIQSCAQGARSPCILKEWGEEKFVELVGEIKKKWERKYVIVQVGSESDFEIGADVDLRGKSDIRQTGFLLANARLFVGLEGFLMHLARSVECPSVIIYGGRLKPWQVGYICNVNITGECGSELFREVGCWKSETCNYNIECMTKIGVERVMDGVEELLGRDREKELEVEEQSI